MTQRSSKAQLITILVLVLFLLMVTLLFSFVVININTNNLAQSLAVSSSSSNYGIALRLSASQFAKASASSALTTLATYEITPSLRKGNLISNFNLFLSQLTINGMIPNDTSGYPQNAMKNLTFAAYNASIAKLLGFASQAVTINETRPVFFQPDPYHLGVRYTENIAINASGNMYMFNIPVNVSISLNNTPDLFYAQQGILRTVKFASINNLTTFIENVSAISGNTVGYVYGTLYTVPSNAITSATCPLPNLPYSLGTLMKSTIIVTYNALNLGACINGYGGLVTYVAPTSTPTVPYLVYAANTNMLVSLPNGEQVLIYGPNLHLIYIENLRNAINSGYYFASPFTPSYIDRAVANFFNQSPNGIFTFSNYNTQSANFDGVSSGIVAGVPNSLTVNQPFAVSLWFNMFATTGSNEWLIGFGTSGNAWNLGFRSGTPTTLESDFWAQFNPAFVISTRKWYHVVVVYNGGNTQTVYLNGVASNTISSTWNVGSGGVIQIGKQLPGYTEYFDGSIANIQIYNTSLSPLEVNKLYLAGIGGVPIHVQNLVGWWPLNGNANDISGNSNNGISTAVSYSLLQNYSRDSIFITPVSTPLAPLPGVLSDTNNSQASNALVPKLFLGSLPLEIQTNLMQAAQFNSLQSSYISTGTTGLPTGSSARTMTAWVDVPTYYTGTCGLEVAVGYGTYSTCQGNFADLGLDYAGHVSFAGCGDDYYSTLTVPLNTLVFIAAVYASGSTQATVYMNAQSSTGSLSPPGNVLNTPTSGLTSDIGESPGGYCFFNGMISNAQIYSSALSPQQVKLLYNGGVFGAPPFGSVVGWWPLNGNANDYSGYGNNGIGTNVLYPARPAGYLPPYGPPVSGFASIWQVLNITNN